MMPHSVLYLLLLSTLSTMSCVKIKKGSRLSGTISSQDDTWARDSIPVCFEQQEGYDQDKATIQDVVTAEFAKADIFFEGWQLCQEGQKGIRIRFDRDATFSHTTGFGREIDGVYAGMILGSKTSCSMPFTGSHCQKNMALHEFGHALGLHHEMNRRDQQGCHQHDQNDGHGEDGTLQIGAFDARSIMNYCYLYQANKTDQALDLSQGDLQTLRERVHGVIATMAPELPFVVNQSTSVKVEGYDVLSYRYQLGTADQMECRDPSNYGPETTISTQIRIDHAPQKDRQKLCIIGKNSHGAWQSTDNFSSVDFFFASANEKASPQLTQDISFPQGVDAKVDLKMTLKVQHVHPIKSIEASIEYQEFDNLFLSTIHNDPMTTKDLGGGQYEISFPADHLFLNGFVAMTKLAIEDLYGNRMTLYGGHDTPNFYGSNWKVPKTWVYNGVEFSSFSVTFQDLSEIPTQMTAGSLATFPIKVSHGLNLDFNRANLQFKQGSVYFTALTRTIRRLDEDTIEVALIIPDQVVNGRYIISSITLFDELHESYGLYSQTGQQVYSKTNIPLADVTITGGLDLQHQKPNLQNIQIVESKTPRELIYLDLEIQHSIAVNNQETMKPAVTLKPRSPGDQRSTIYGKLLGEVAGKWRFEIRLNSTVAPGSYYIERVQFFDKARNEYLYHGNTADQNLSGAGSVVAPSILIP